MTPFGDAARYDPIPKPSHSASALLADANGLLVVAQDGGVFSMGSPPYYGSVPDS